MKAVVMAGGEGSRLRPLTVGRPKPMVPLANKPVVGHIVDLLKRHGITEVVMTVQYMADAIQRYFGDGQGLGMKINYSVEEVPLGTAGSVQNAKAFLDEPFLVISGDAATDIDLEKLIRFHQEKKAKFTITLYRVPNPLEYGVVIVDDNGRIQRFLEKPSWGEVISDTVNTGIYVVEPEVLDYIEPGRSVDWSQDVFPVMMQKGDPLFGHIADGYWCDVGNLQEYQRATNDILEGRVQVEPMGEERLPKVWCEEDVEFDESAHLEGPIFLGSGVRIRPGAELIGPTVIRDNTIIDARAHIERSIIWRNCYIGEGADIRGAIVGAQCGIKSRAVLFEGAVVADNNVIGEQAVIHPNVKIWPGKEVESGAIVKTSIVWGSQGRRVLFGRYGVTGVVNVDMSPEFAAKLGAAFGATLPRGATVTINRDPHRSPRMIKRAVISGLPSSGVNVLDVRSVPIPVARYYTRAIGAAGGVHVRLSPFDPRVIDVRFIDGTGRNLSKDDERKIERVFFREDFRRVYSDEVGTIQYAPNVIEMYVEGFKKAIDVEAVRNGQFRVVIDYANSPVSLVLPELLNDLGCSVVAINERMDEAKMSITEAELQDGLKQLSSICEVLRTDFGARVDVAGEMVYLGDDTGKIIDSITASAVMTALAVDVCGAPCAIVFPVTLPVVFDDLAKKHGGKPVRTSLDLYTVADVAEKEGAILALDGRGGFILPQFQSMPDAMMAIAKLLEWLAICKTRVSQVIAGLPEWHLAARDVEASWEAKGAIMRHLHEQHTGQRTETVDGLKVWFSDRSWVIILPDPDRPLFHIHAEGETAKAAEELADRYARIIESLRS